MTKEKMMKNIKNSIVDLIKQYKSSLVKFTGLLVCVGIIAIFASCKEKEVIYSSSEYIDETGINVKDSDEISTNSRDGDEISINSKDGDEINSCDNDKTVNEESSANSSDSLGLAADEGSSESIQKTMVVYICGAVNAPGVYTLNSDSRVSDGIVAAGGVSNDACEEALNLAESLKDGCKIYVPTKEEVGDKPLFSDSVVNGSGLGVAVSDSLGSGKKAVNINVADIDELMTLTGIGESRAKSIVEYRQKNGAFKNISEIMKVSGIKESSFNKIKDEITVE